VKQIQITIAYDGSNYHGWQIQNNAITIQEEIIKAAKSIFKGEVKVTGASRTDTGVHALGQVATIVGNTNVSIERLPYALNAHLPEDIVVYTAKLVDDTFHPRYSAKEKIYSYKIYNGKYKIPQLCQYAYFFPKELSVIKMKEASKYFIGEHDFIGFSSSGSSVKSTIRTINNLNIIKENDIVEIIVQGNGFLYNMVRIIAGTLIDVGLGKTKVIEIPKIIKSRDRNLAGKTAPANGLTLVKIIY